MAFNALMKFDLARKFDALASSMASLLDSKDSWTDEDEHTADFLADSVLLPSSMTTVVPV